MRTAAFRSSRNPPSVIDDRMNAMVVAAMTHVILFATLWLGCCVYGLVRGGTPERIGACVFLIAPLLSVAVESPQTSQYHHVEIGVLLVDIAIFAAFLTLALRAQRFWPLWMSAMQGVEVLSHAAIALNPEVIPWAYWRAVALWSYPMLLLLATATIMHRRRLRQYGADPSWKRF
jgi:hypothetical protein